MTLTIKTHGEFYYKTDHTKGRRPFEMAIRAPSLKFFEQKAYKTRGMDEKGNQKIEEIVFFNVRGIIKKRLLPLLLSKKFKDFIRVRSVIIDEVAADDGTPLNLPIQLMSRPQLAELVAAKKIPIDTRSYIEIDELRSDIIEYREDPDTFLKNYDARIEKRREEREFMDLNNLSDAPVNTVQVKQASSQPDSRPGRDVAPGGLGQPASILD